MRYHPTHLFEEYREPMKLSFGEDYREHLDHPLELLADITAVLTAYPKAAAQRTFADCLPRDRELNVDEVVSRARVHMGLVGFQFEKQPSLTENPHYPAGMIHYMKLRCAMLVEYDV